MKKLFLTCFLMLSLLPAGCLSRSNQKTPAEELPKKETTNTSQQEKRRSFTLDELKKYDGKNGNPAYVAVDGTVYDVTKNRAWRNGVHKQCSKSTYAGADYTALVKKSPHGASVMKVFPVVGSIKK